jgi:hypothetical protein
MDLAVDDYRVIFEGLVINQTLPIEPIDKEKI